MPDSSSPAADSAPLLTIAIPTYNRSACLGELLAMLAAQDFDSENEVEIIVSDNASVDNTEAVVAAIAQGCKMRIRYHRHPENIGANPNFAFCYREARGRYFWLFGDDDLILPGKVEEVLSHLRGADLDIIYATSYGFRENWLAERKGDPLNRRFHTITSARAITHTVNIMFTFISGIIVNKERLESIPHEDPTKFLHTHLVQLAWTLPLLRNHRRSLVLWDRPVAGKLENSGVYSVGDIFGNSLVSVAADCLPDRPDLVRILASNSLRRWFPSVIYDHRLKPDTSYDVQKDYAALHRLHRRNWRYWLFLWPVFKLPLPLANLWVKVGSVLNKCIYIAHLPGFWRKQT
jgi:glycosyltransferase involved in cell wall biosynthesis